MKKFLNIYNYLGMMQFSHQKKNISILSSEKCMCNICASDVYKRRILKCPFCTFECCVNCVEAFLLGIDDIEPRCMSPGCKKIWSHEFTSKNLGNSFNKKYLERRSSILFEREKSLFPSTQPLVKRFKKTEKKKLKIKKYIEQIKLYKQAISSLNEKIRLLRVEEDDDTYTNSNKPKKKFIQKCPVDNCKGFLSTSLKCGICSTYVCTHCHLPKKGKHDEEHKCDSNTVETVKLLKSDTKPCPSCSIPIYKISGCDQMYCVECHTAFSWKKGTIERGVIHNPHYYEMQRKLNNGRSVRRDIAMRCGGPPSVNEIRRKLNKCNIDFKNLYNLHRLIGHISANEINNYPRVVGNMDNSDLRVNYLRNFIDEKRFKSTLKYRMKRNEKNNEFRQVLEMFTATLVDMFGNICEGDEDTVIRNITNFESLRQYTNDTLKNIGERYKNIYPCITKSWKFNSNSKNVYKDVI
jgi:hypothetical protein